MRAAPPRSGLFGVIAVTLAAVLAACGSSGAPSSDPGAAATGEAIVGRPGPLATATTVPGSGTPVTSETASPEAAARAALDTYVDSLTSQTFGRAMAASEGPAQRMALIRLVQAEHNRIRGGSTTVELLDRTFTAVRARPSRVTFRGFAVLRSTVTGTAGASLPPPSVRRISDPVVERRGSTWVVSSFAWEGEPVVAYEGGQTLSFGGIELRLEGALAFGDAVGVVVLLVAEGTRNVRVEADRLRLGGAEVPSTFRTLIGGQPGVLYMTYARRSAAPRSWLASVIVDDGEPTEAVLAF